MRVQFKLKLLLLVFSLLAAGCSVSAPVDGTQVTTSGDLDPTPTATAVPEATPETAPPDVETSPEPTIEPVEPTTVVPATPDADVAGETIGIVAGQAIATVWADAWGLRGGGAACWNESAPAGLANASPEWLTTGDDPELEQFIADLVMTCGIEDEAIGTALVMVLGLSEQEAACVTASLDATELTIASAAAIGNQGNQGQDELALQSFVDASGCATDGIAVTDDRGPPPVPPPPADDRIGDLVGPTVAATAAGLWGLSGEGALCWNENASIGFSNVSQEFLTTRVDNRLEQFLANVIIYCDVAVEVIGSTLSSEFDVPRQQATCVAESLTDDELIIGAAVAIGDQGNSGQREITVQRLIDSYPDCAT